MIRQFPAGLALLFAIALIVSSDASAENPIRSAIETVQSIGPEGEGNEAAIEAVAKLRKLPVERLPRILDAMKVESPIARNWFQGIAQDILRQSETVDPELLAAYVVDRTRNPHGRALAMQLYRQRKPDAANKLIDNSLNDPSLLIREMAVDRALARASSMEKEDPESTVTLLTEVLAAARHPRQLKTIINKLSDLGSDVTMSESLAMITQWKCAAPFDNSDETGFDTAYEPETRFIANGKLDLGAKYEGKNGPVVWQPVSSEDTAGFVDLAEPYEKVKGAVAYLYLEREISDAMKAQVRLTTKNANKIWVNGTEVAANEVYHSGSVLDQYIGDCELVEGTNHILIKLCQNEQTEPWAQEFQFQCRLTDRMGKPIR